VLYRETLLAVLLDQRAMASCWSNELTISWRAPQGEADAWEPIFRRVLESIQVNALWWTRESTASFERSRIVVDTAQEIRRLDQEIWENRQRTNERIQRQFSDYLTGQQRYLDPYDLEVVTDWASADYRWVTPTGEVLYTDDSLYDPNSDSRVWNHAWERSPEIGR
jgi:hypothetical protein